MNADRAPQLKAVVGRTRLAELRKNMAFEDIKVIDPYVEKGWTAELKLTLATPAEVDALEANLNVSMPVGNKEYVTTLGFGNYCNYIRIDMPSRILSGYEEYRGFLREYWFWEMGEEILAKEKALESIKIGDTIDGDVIIFHPHAATNFLYCRGMTTCCISSVAICMKR